MAAKLLSVDFSVAVEVGDTIFPAGIADGIGDGAALVGAKPVTNGKSDANKSLPRYMLPLLVVYCLLGSISFNDVGFLKTGVLVAVVFFELADEPDEVAADWANAG